MYRIMTLLIVLLFSTGLCWAAEKPVINGQEDEVSYSVGHQVGRDLVRQGVNVNSDLLLQGILDATNKNEPLMPFEQMLDTLAAFKERIVDQAKKQNQSARIMGEKFLADNATKKGVVTLESGLQYKIIKSGMGKKPAANDQVEVSYVSKDIYGKVFDTTHKGGSTDSVQFKVSDVIPGWLEALQLMEEGSKWELYVPYQLAFKDSTPLAGQAVIFELELLKVVN